MPSSAPPRERRASVGRTIGQGRSIARDESGQMRFAGDRATEEARRRREEMIERFREDHANFRSKGFSDRAAADAAQQGLQSGERPQPSRRYQMLEG